MLVGFGDDLAEDVGSTDVGALEPGGGEVE
jgi:hypothetical protein